jgi:hypothetical protein
MPLAYLILQLVMLQFYYALFCGLDLSHPIVQHDLLCIILFLLGDQPHDAHMEEAIPEAAVPQSPGPASPLPAPAPCPVHGYAPCPHEVCNRTDQIIRAQGQKQAPKCSNFRTWAHIIPVVNRNHEGFQTNLLTTRIASFNIQHHTLHFTSSSEISLHTRSRNYYKPSL